MKINKNTILATIIGILFVLIFFKGIFFTNKSFFQRDTLILFHPWMSFSKEMINRGELPLWNPYTDCGMPFLASMQAGVFYPLNLPFYLFNFVAAYKIYIFIHFLLAFMFMYFFLKDFEFSAIAAIAGAAAWTFSGTMITRVEFFSVLGSTIYLPLELLLLKRLFSSEGINSRVKYIILTSIAVAAGFFAGHPQEFMNGIFFLVCYLVYMAISRRNTRFLLDFVFMTLLTVSVTAIQLIPSAEFILNSNRVKTDAGAGIGLDYENSTLLCLELKEFRNLVYPFFYKEQVIDRAKNEKVLNIPHLWIYSHHIGFIAMIFSIIGLIYYRGRIKYFLLAMTVVSMILSMGKFFPLYPLMHKLMLPLRLIRHPATIMYLAVFCLCFLACAGFDKLKKEYVIAVILILVFAELYRDGHGMNLAIDGSIYEKTGPNITFLTQHNGLHRFVLTPVTHNPGNTAGKNLFDSFVNYKDKLYNNVNMPYHLYNFYGQDTELGSYFTYLNRAYSKNSLDSANKLYSLANVKYVLSVNEIKSKLYRLSDRGNFFIYENMNCLPRALLVSRAKYIPREETLDYIDSGKFDPKKEVVINAPLDNLLPSLLPGGEKARLRGDSKTEIVSYQPNKVVIKAEAGGNCWLVLFDTYFPGWQAKVNGIKTDVYRADYLFRAVKLSKGNNEVVFIYSPLSFKLGAIISILSALGMLIYVVFNFRSLTTVR